MERIWWQQGSSLFWTTAFPIAMLGLQTHFCIERVGDFSQSADGQVGLPAEHLPDCGAGLIQLLGEAGFGDVCSAMSLAMSSEVCATRSRLRGACGIQDRRLVQNHENVGEFNLEASITVAAISPLLFSHDCSISAINFT